MAPSVPNKKARLATLLATSLFACVASCIGLNALIRSNQSQSSLKKLAPAPTVLDIDVSKIYNVGILLTVGNILLALVSCAAFNLTIFPPFQALSNKTVKLQAAALTFCTVWVLACMIPFTYWFATGSAKITAFIGNIQLPASLVASTVAASGHSAKYSTMWYLRLFAIFPWIAIASAFVSVAVLFKSPGVVPATAAAAVANQESRLSNNGSIKKEEITNDEKVEQV